MGIKSITVYREGANVGCMGIEHDFGVSLCKIRDVNERAWSFITYAKRTESIDPIHGRIDIYRTEV